MLVRPELRRADPPAPQRILPVRLERPVPAIGSGVAPRLTAHRRRRIPKHSGDMPDGVTGPMQVDDLEALTLGETGR